MISSSIAIIVTHQVPDPRHHEQEIPRYDRNSENDARLEFRLAATLYSHRPHPRAPYYSICLVLTRPDCASGQVTRNRCEMQIGPPHYRPPHQGALEAITTHTFLRRRHISVPSVENIACLPNEPTSFRNLSGQVDYEVLGD